MKNTILIFLSIVLVSALGVTNRAEAGSYTVKRVRYCTSGLLYDNKCAKSETSADFPQWDNHNIKGSRKKMTYIAVVSEPDIDKVKHVVFISAGQQVEVAINPDGYQNVLTGQPADYKNNCLGKTKTCVRNFDPRSLAMRLKNSGLYDLSDTLFILVLDSQYNYYLQNKSEMFDAYWEFLTSKFYASNIKDIVLAGQSRGGCLSLLLAQRFRNRNEYKNIPLVLQLNDAVCRNDGSEVPGIHSGSKTYAHNPLNPNKFKSVLVNMGALFPATARTDLYINDLHAGGKVGGLNIRSLTYKPENTDIGWWRQTWVNFNHTDMGGNFSNDLETITPAYDHIARSLHKIRWGKRLPTAFAPVDINGDGASDIIMFEKGVRRSGTSNYLDDIKLKIRLSKKDGSYEEHNSTILGARPQRILHPITPFLPGYFSNDRKTDIVNLVRSPTRGLQIQTLVSQGDGSFRRKNYNSGDGNSYEKYPVLVGDVNRDGLSDLLLFHRDPARGLIVRVKFSKGNGQYRATEFQLGDGPSVDSLPILLADINGDNKTDIIIQDQDQNGHKIRTKISNGDGTFNGHEFGTGEWLYWGHDQFLVGDINKDRKSDLIRIFYDKTKGLRIHSFLSRGDGTFDVKRQLLGDDEPGYTFPAIISDIDGDRRDDIVLRYRDSNNNLIVNAKLSNGDGTYRTQTSNLGQEERMDANPALIGQYDQGRNRDIAFHSVIRENNNAVRSNDSIWTYIGKTSGQLSQLGAVHETSSLMGLGADAYPALSGPVTWRGQGGTFPVCRPPVCAMPTPTVTTGTLSVPITTPVQGTNEPPTKPGTSPVSKNTKPVKKRQMGRIKNRK